MTKRSKKGKLTKINQDEINGTKFIRIERNECKRKEKKKKRKN
jgi:hypothetical protein